MGNDTPIAEIIPETSKTTITSTEPANPASTIAHEYAMALVHKYTDLQAAKYHPHMNIVTYSYDNLIHHLNALDTKNIPRKLEDIAKIAAKFKKNPKEDRIEELLIQLDKTIGFHAKNKDNIENISGRNGGLEALKNNIRNDITKKTAQRYWTL